jgi:DNA-binding transcriptional LysR family regulator
MWATIEGGQAVLGPILAEYSTLNPGVRLQVELTDRRVDLVEEDFDVAIRTGALPDSTLIAKRLSLIGAFRVLREPPLTTGFMLLQNRKSSMARGLDSSSSELY